MLTWEAVRAAEKEKPLTDSHSGGADIVLGWVLCRQLGEGVIFHMDRQVQQTAFTPQLE
jgi:hypothetical protein